MFLSEAAHYLRERLLTVRILLLWLLLLAAIVLSSAERVVLLPGLAITSALFVLSFRLWDDLADLGYDRLHRPERSLLRSTDIRFFHAAQWFLIVVLTGLLLATTSHGQVVVFLCLVVFMWVMYRVTPNRPQLRPVRVGLVLAKYPALVMLLALEPGTLRALFAALGIYLLLVLYEIRSTGMAILMPSSVIAGFMLLAQWVLIP